MENTQNRRLFHICIYVPTPPRPHPHQGVAALLHLLCVLWIVAEELHQAAEEGNGGFLRDAQVVGAEGKAVHDVADHLHPQHDLVAWVLC